MEFTVEKKPERTITFLDGAMGTMLQKHGLQTGEKPELLCFTHEDLIEQIHRQYLAAGSQIIYTNTFGANARKLEGSGYGVSQVVCKAVQIARRACAGTGARVALDVGPIGELLEPVGTLTFDETYSLFEEIVTAGEQAGADLVVFETMADLYEVKAAVLENAAPNQIILLHDIYDSSVDAALSIVDALKAEGYRFVTVEELLQSGGIQPEAGVLYCSADG